MVNYNKFKKQTRREKRIIDQKKQKPSTKTLCASHFCPPDLFFRAHKIRTGIQSFHHHAFVFPGTP